MLYNIYKFISWRNISNLTHGRVVKTRYLFVCYLSAIFIVFFNCGVKCSFAFDKAPKFSSSSFYFGNGLIEARENFSVPKESSWVQTFEFVKNYISEFLGGFNEFIYFFSVQDETMRSNNAEKANANTNGPCDIFGKNVAQNFPIIVPFIISIVVVSKSNDK